MQNILGAKVTWKEDHRPMPDTTPGLRGNNDPAWNLDLILEKEGILLGIERTVFGRLLAVVVVEGGKIVEVNAQDIKVNMPSR